jgi:anti-sigma regulatory factor (Ser/Thr protein kinase)
MGIGLFQAVRFGAIFFNDTFDKAALPQCQTMTSLDSDHNGSLRIGNTIAEMKKVVDFVDRFCAILHLPRDIANDINLCLDELLNNTISYGYDDQDEHSILVTLSITGDWMIAEIKDDGKPFDPRQSAPPNPFHRTSIGGVLERVFAGNLPPFFLTSEVALKPGSPAEF